MSSRLYFPLHQHPTNTIRHILSPRLRRQKLDARSDSLASRKRLSHRMSAALNDSPLSLSHHRQSQRQRTSPYYRATTGRSISPPSLKDVPGLSHAETMNSLSSRSSSSTGFAPSSARGTPTSISISTCSSNGPGPDNVMVADNTASPSGSSMCYSYMSVPATATDPKQKDAPHPKLQHGQGRKHRVSGTGFVARFFASASAAGAYMPGRIGRPHVT